MHNRMGAHAMPVTVADAHSRTARAVAIMATIAAAKRSCTSPKTRTNNHNGKRTTASSLCDRPFEHVTRIQARCAQHQRQGRSWPSSQSFVATQTAQPSLQQRQQSTFSSPSPMVDPARIGRMDLFSQGRERKQKGRFGCVSFFLRLLRFCQRVCPRTRMGRAFFRICLHAFF